MKRSQRIILCVGALVIAGFCLRPPHQWDHQAYIISRNSSAPHRVETITEKIGHYWIWAPPAGWEEIPYPMVRKTRQASVDWQRLGVYVGLATIITLLFSFVVFSRRA